MQPWHFVAVTDLELKRRIRAGAEDRVEIDLQPERGGTRLRLRHSGLPEELLPRHADRWAYYLGRLEATTDERRPMADPAP